MKQPEHRKEEIQKKKAGEEQEASFAEQQQSRRRSRCGKRGKRKYKERTEGQNLQQPSCTSFNLVNLDLNY
jgi:hypothetical protein